MNRFIAISIVAAAALLLFAAVDRSQACSAGEAAQIGSPSDGVLTVAEADDEGDAIHGDESMQGDDSEGSASSEDQPATDEGSGEGTDEGGSSEGGSSGDGGD